MLEEVPTLLRRELVEELAEPTPEPLD